MKQTLQQVETIIKNLAEQEIMPRYNRVASEFKADGSLVTEADTAMQAAVMAALNKHWPEYALLGEEMTEQEQQVLLDKDDSQGLWVLDPLDGTSNFASAIPIFSVSLALIQQGEVQLGLVYDPVRKECFSALKGQGAWLNGRDLKCQVDKQELGQCIAGIDFKRLPETMAIQLALEHPFSSQRNFGSGALDWCWLAAGRCQLYIHGGQKLWDYLAGQLILREAGGIAETFEGDEVFIKGLMKRSVVASVNRVLFDKWKAAIKA
ncbi:MAG: inositol monophosphatase family protein [Gammaproteobacteria bacterium]|nr:inositol monophosphatase family protein [Gammaproteobacteria bacterium]